MLLHIYIYICNTRDVSSIADTRNDSLQVLARLRRRVNVFCTATLIVYNTVPHSRQRKVKAILHKLEVLYLLASQPSVRMSGCRLAGHAEDASSCREAT